MERPATHPHLGLLLPLCTSSASIGLSLFQYPLFLSFSHPPASLESTSISGRPFSQFWKNFLPGAVGLVAGGCITSTVSGALAWRWLRDHGHLETTEVANWYLWGASFAALHLAFAPMVAGPIQAIIKGVDDAGKTSTTTDTEVQTKNKEMMDSWLVWHTVRTATVDFAAVWCFAKGVESALWVV